MPPYIGSFSPNFSLEADAWGGEEEDEIKTDKLFDMKELKKSFREREVRSSEKERIRMNQGAWDLFVSM